MTTLAERPLPFVVPEYCKGCGRCIDSCIKDCIRLSTEINPLTGLVPIVLDLAQCNGCGLCIDACPEPYGLRPAGADELLRDGSDAPVPIPQPDRTVPLPAREPLVVK